MDGVTKSGHVVGMTVVVTVLVVHVGYVPLEHEVGGSVVVTVLVVHVGFVVVIVLLLVHTHDNVEGHTSTRAVLTTVLVTVIVVVVVGLGVLDTVGVSDTVMNIIIILN